MIGDSRLGLPRHRVMSLSPSQRPLACRIKPLPSRARLLKTINVSLDARNTSFLLAVEFAPKPKNLHIRNVQILHRQQIQRTIRIYARSVLTGLAVLGILLSPPPAPARQAPAASLMVIAPKQFHADLADFIKHKNHQLPTRLVALEKILKDTPGVDDPARVKQFLYNAWRKNGVRYALLVGDADVFPVRYMVLDRVTPPAFDYAFYPSDLYYGDVARADGSFDDWNGQKEGVHATYFGEVRGEKNKGDPINFDSIHYKPEIAVGRWPVSTVEEVRMMAAKSILHESQTLSQPSAPLPKVAWFGVGGWVDSRPLLEKLAKSLEGRWQSEKRYYKDQHDYGTPAPDHRELLNILNNDPGVGLICHTGHGQDLAWEQCLSVGDIPRMTNINHTPVMVSIGCSTARFATLPPYEPYVDVNGNSHAGSDHKEVFTSPPPPPACYQSGRYNPPGLGEQLLRNGKSGAIAYIGCNTGSQPCALSLLEGFIGALSHQQHPRLGDCWNEAISFYYDNEHLATLKPDAEWYPPSIFFQGMKFMMFGDPTLPMASTLTPSKK